MFIVLLTAQFRIDKGLLTPHVKFDSREGEYFIGMKWCDGNSMEL
jgi:hypothetical protein